MVYTIFVFDMHTETVCVRIGCQNQVCIDFFCKFQSQFESFFCFRVRITYRREIAVRQLLLRHHIHMGHADPVEDRPYRLIAGAV